MSISKHGIECHNFLLLVVCLVLLSYGSSATAPGFQFFKLVLQWPPSFCSLSESNCKRTPLPLAFTIHGLWPDNKSQELRYCTSNLVPNIKSDFAKQLDKSWPDLKEQHQTPPDEKFWIREWNKHGTCSSNMYSPTDYFKKALVLKSRYNVLVMLQEKQYKPGTKMLLLAEVNLTIADYIGGLPIIKCPKGLLTEVIICVDPIGGTVVNCPLPAFSKPCPQTKIDFPATVKPQT